jgi:hypothetical protein
MINRKFFHGSNLELTELKSGSYVTKSFKDACKFGYRKSVVNNSEYVYIYETEPKDLISDKNRDRAYILNENCKVELKDRFNTYETPYKLRKFKL